jgi:hypothetical protein
MIKLKIKKSMRSNKLIVIDPMEKEENMLEINEIYMVAK